MEQRELEHFNTSGIKYLHSIPNLPVWIIEYAWAHKMSEILEVLDHFLWPNDEPLTLEESWRLRLESAQAYSIMKNRDISRFERVMSFLEATYRLLPRLVASIKHMKIMFGLKTMVIMWMFREGQGIVPTVVKIIQFFPSKLPQYQDQCSHHEMFLMRKNHQDFKAMAQSLAMDKDKLQNYIKNQMEEEYGEHYAQKVEDRLLHYLQELETVLPRDTYIDKLLKKEHPITEEEKLVLEVITCDSTPIETSLKRLLRCAVGSRRRTRVSQKSRNRGADVEHACPSKAALYARSSEAPVEVQPEVVRRGDEAAQDPSKHDPLLLSDEDEEDSDGGVRSQQPMVEEGEEVVEEEALDMAEDEPECGALEDGYAGVARTKEGDGAEKEEEEEEEEAAGNSDGEKGDSQRSAESVQEAVSSPQFCSKHQRWVKSILRGCSDEGSEELQRRTDVTTSPKLFSSSSSSSSSSSQDLTPSLLIPCPPVQPHPPSKTKSPSQAAQVSGADPADTLGSGSAGQATESSQTEPSAQLSHCGDIPVATPLSPAPQAEYASCSTGETPAPRPQRVFPPRFAKSSNEQSPSAPDSPLPAPPGRRTSGSEGAAFAPPQTVAPLNPTNTTYRLTLTHPQLAAVQPQRTATVAYLQTVPVSQNPPTSADCLPPTRQPFSKLSRRFGQARPTIRHAEQAPTRFGYTPLPEQSGNPPTDVQSVPPQGIASTSQPGTLSLNSTANHIPLYTKPSCEQGIHLQPVTVPQTATSVPSPLCEQRVLSHSLNLPRTRAPAYVASSIPDGPAGRPEAGGGHGAQLGSSLRSQAALLQPYVKLTRLNQREYRRVAEGRALLSVEEEGSDDDDDDDGGKEEEGGENQRLAHSDFDLNILFSGDDSSSNDSEGSDPDYIPYTKKTYYHRV